MTMMFGMQCFTECTSVDYAWQQAQLSLSIVVALHGLRCISHHTSAAYIASLTASGSNPNPLYALYNITTPLFHLLSGSVEAALQSQVTKNF